MRRRDMVRGTGALAVAALSMPAARVTAGSPALPLHPDAELLSLGRELTVARANLARIDTLPVAERTDELCDRLMEPANAIVQRIEAITPTTLGGLLVQAQAVDFCRTGDPFDVADLDFYMPSGVTTDVRLAVGIANALVGMTKAAAVGAAS